MKSLLLLVIKLYSVIVSPLMGANCRFYPTCSAYALEAISEHGAGKGSYLAIKRILRCHPWHRGGYDPVSVRGTKQHEETCGCGPVSGTLKKN